MKHLHQLPSNTFLKTVPSQQGLNRPQPSFTSFWTHVHARGVGNPALSPAFHTAHQLGPLPSASLLGKRHQLCGTTCHFGEAPKIRAPHFSESTPSGLGLKAAERHAGRHHRTSERVWLTHLRRLFFGPMWGRSDRPTGAENLSDQIHMAFVAPQLLLFLV